MIIFLSTLSILFFSACNNNYPTLIPVTDIAFEPELSTKSISLTIGGTYHLNAKAKPDNATNKRLTYTSDKIEIASVNAEGVITALKTGSAKITIKATGAIAKEITVTVRSVQENTPNEGPIAVTGISLEPDETTISLVNGTDRQIKAHVIPKNATNKKLTYTSDNQTIASIDDKGLITAKAVGNAHITIKAADGISKTVNLTVTAAPVPVTSIAIEGTTPASLFIGESYRIMAKAQPDGATNKELSYTADNDKADVAYDGTVTAQSEGTVNITVKSQSNPGITATVTITIKQRPSIELIEKEITSESSGSDLYLEIKTLHGKLSYTPKIVGEESGWLSIVNTDTTTSTEKDTIHLKATQNKTVWKRIAYINFEDGSNQVIKNAKGEKLEVKVVQEENKNPVVTIQWVHGIGEPKQSEKEKIEIPHTHPKKYWDNSYIFFWNETTETKWFNTRKVSLLEIPAPEGADGNQCWAKTASNMLHWWFVQNEGNINKYIENKSQEEKNKYAHYYKRELPTEREKEKSYIANTFRLKAHNNKQGDFIISGLGWYLYGGSPGISRKDKPAFEGPALFKDVFSKDEGKTPIKVERVYNRTSLNDVITKAIESKKAIGITLEGSKGTNGYAHAITLWGAAFDEEGNIIVIYVVDNNFTPNRVFPYGIYYKEGLPYLFNYPNNAPVSNKHVGEVTTLDKGEAQWEEWKSNHP